MDPSAKSLEELVQTPPPDIAASVRDLVESLLSKREQDWAQTVREAREQYAPVELQPQQLPDKTEDHVTLEQALTLVEQLSPLDKARLIELIAPDSAPDVGRERQGGEPAPRISLRGLWRGLDITEQDIAEARREMWGNYPRENI